MNKWLIGIITLSIAGTANSSILFQETFDDNSNGWTNDSNWQVTEGVYKFSSSTDLLPEKVSMISVSNIKPSSYDNLRISYDLRFDPSWVGFSVGAIWEGLSGNSTDLTASKEYSNVQSGNLSTAAPIGIAVADEYFDFGVWHNIEFNLASGVTTLTVDGLDLFSAVNTTAHDIDLVGFHSRRANVSFDNLQIEVTSVPLPAAAWFFCSGLIGLIGFKRRSSTLIATQ